MKAFRLPILAMLLCGALLDAGAKIDGATPDDATAFLYAAGSARTPQIVSTLLKAGPG